MSRQRTIVVLGAAILITVIIFQHREIDRLRHALKIVVETGQLNMRWESICGRTSAHEGMDRQQAREALKTDGYPVEQIENSNANEWHLRKSSLPGSPIRGLVCNIWITLKSNRVEKVTEAMISN